MGKCRVKNEAATICYETVWKDLRNLMESTLVRGESNSALVLGPRGSGKTRLVRGVLDDLRDGEELRGEGIPVFLNGLLQRDDKGALKEITKQLQLQNVVGDKVFGSFAEHLEFLLKSLVSGGKLKSKPIIFVLDEFDLFASNHQTLLYNLFDVAQSKAAPLCVIGISSQLDVIERLEKRVRSRFSHRQLYMHNLESFEDYFSVARGILIEYSASVPSDDAFKKCLEEVFLIRRDISYLKKILSLALLFEGPKNLTEGLRRSLNYLNVDTEIKEIMDLTLLELALLISAKHLRFLYDGQPFNFEMVYHEFQKFVARRNCTVLKYEKPIVAKAFETLIRMELITPTEKGCKTQKEYRLYSLQVTTDQIIHVVQNDKTIPLDIKEWGASELH